MVDGVGGGGAFSYNNPMRAYSSSVRSGAHTWRVLSACSHFLHIFHSVRPTEMQESASIEGRVTKRPTGITRRRATRNIVQNDSFLRLKKKYIDDKKHSSASEKKLALTTLKGLTRAFVTGDGKERWDTLVTKHGNTWSDLVTAYKNGSLAATDMAFIFCYRQMMVDDLIDIVQEKFKKEGHDCDIIALGSTDLTSDYDISIVAKDPRHRAFEATFVAEFNKAFREKHGCESGTVFDTNVYTSHTPTAHLLHADMKKSLRNLRLTLPKNPVKRFVFQVKVKLGLMNSRLQGNVLSAAELAQKEGVMSSVEGRHIEDRMENTLALAKFLRYAPKSLVEAYRDSVYKRPALKKNYDEALALLTKVNEKLEKKEAEIRASGTESYDIPIQASNRLYEETLQELSVYIDRRNQALQDAEDSVQNSDTKRAYKASADALLIHIETLRGEALFYANEAHAGKGAVLHVIEGLQAKSALVLPKERYHESALEQFGFLFENLHLSPDNERFDTAAIVKASKYGYRLFHALSHVAPELSESVSKFKTLHDALYKECRGKAGMQETAKNLLHEAGFLNEDGSLNCEKYLQALQEVAITHSEVFFRDAEAFAEPE